MSGGGFVVGYAVVIGSWLDVGEWDREQGRGRRGGCLGDGAPAFRHVDRWDISSASDRERSIASNGFILDTEIRNVVVVVVVGA